MKDERIFIQIFKNRPCVDCPAASNMKNCTCPDLYRFLHGINKSEAIERAAKGIHYYEWKHHNNMPKWNELNSDIQNDYRKMSEAALKALLEEE